MNKILILILFAVEISLFGQTIDINEYISVTKTILSHEELNQNLIKYSRFYLHPTYDSNDIFILDTVYVDKEIIINDFNPRFCITNFLFLKIGSVNYWLLPTDITLKGNSLKYSFITQSYKWQDSTEYIEGIINLKKINGNWIIRKTNIKPYQFKEQKEIECYNKIVKCTSDHKYKTRIKTNNPFYGNWQFLKDSIYYEVFFSDDTIYIYDENLGHAPVNLKYKITDTDLIISYINNFHKLNYQIIDKNKIRIFGSHKLIMQNDTSIFSDVYIIERIKNNEFKYSDVRCWGIKNANYNCFIDSFDGLKYQKCFIKRTIKYKNKKWKIK